MEEVTNAYEEHIQNKAILSYRYVAPCEGLVAYIAEEICRKDKLVWLRGVLDTVVQGLSETERALLEMRYFGKKRKTSANGACKRVEGWSESTYFRRQRRLEKRLEGLLKNAGMTEQVFDEWFAPMSVFKEVCKGLQRRADALTARERELLH